MRISLWPIALIVLSVLSFPVLAADVSSGTGQQHAAENLPAASEIDVFKLIHADSMTLTRQKEKPQVFQGSVSIILISKDGAETQIEAEKMTIYYDQNLRKVQKIEAEKKVKINRLGTVATTELAVYRGDKDIIELLVKPHVKDSRGELSADKITLFAGSEEVVAEGNVRGIVFPEALE